MSRYNFNQALQIWEAQQAGPVVAFSDGEETERYLSEVFRQNIDLCVDSCELPKFIRDWPSEYHLSPLRYNLLRPFNLNQFKKVLEIGSGCGVITRQFGEAAKHVTALEGNPIRAALTALRCRDLSNVEVVSDNFQNFESDQNFDLVSFIGVLEYAPQFLDIPKPVEWCMQKARSLLSSQGILAIAIENKLGLKYFGGHAEDHLGRAYWGLQNLYQKNSPVTFGKEELHLLLKKAGFNHIEFFYPFPDYKLPKVIISQRALLDPEFSTGQLLSNVYSRSYQGLHQMHFDEALVWDELAKNKVIDHFANSFLVLAAVEPPAVLSNQQWLAKYYSLHLGHHNTETNFERKTKSIVVTKSLLHSSAQIDSKQVNQDTHCLDESKYISGENYHSELKRMLLRGAGIDQLGAWVAKWAEYLRQHALPEESGRVLLPHDFVDCVPYNLIQTPQGELHYIDREWISDSPVRPEWVLIRGLAYSLERCAYKGTLENLQVGAAVLMILTKVGFALGNQELEEALNLEANFLRLMKYEVGPLKSLYLRKVLKSSLVSTICPEHGSDTTKISS